MLILIEDFRILYLFLIFLNFNGLGEEGKVVFNDKDDFDEVSKEKEGYRKYSFNEIVSFKILLERLIFDNWL